MAMSTGFTVVGKLKVGNGSVDLDTDTFNVQLVTDTYTPNYTTLDFRNDLANEPGNSGTYAAGGSALASVTWANSGTEARFDSADPAWTGATITARGCFLYKARGGASSADEVLSGHLFTGGADVVSTAGTFTVVVDSTGWFAAT